MYKLVILILFMSMGIQTRASEVLFTQDSPGQYSLSGPAQINKTYSLELDEGIFFIRFQEVIASAMGDTYIGLINDDPNSHASLTMVNGIADLNFWNDSLSVYSVYLGGGLYNFITTSGYELHNESCSVNVEDGHSQVSFGQENLRIAATDPVVDVMILYTPLAKEKAGGRDAIVARIVTAINNANRNYKNSKVNTRLRLVHTRETLDDEDGNLPRDLTSLIKGDDGRYDEVYNLRNYAAADLVGLFTGKDNANTYGYAQIPTDPAGQANRCFSVNFYNTAGGVFPHEVTHNFGCQHNKSLGGAKLYSYSFGHSWNDNGTKRGSLMSYIGRRVPLLSSPEVMHNGNPTGVANEADNVRTVNRFGSVVEAYRKAKILVDLKVNLSIEGNELSIVLDNLRNEDLPVFDLDFITPQSVSVVSVSGASYDAQQNNLKVNGLSAQMSKTLKVVLESSNDINGQVWVEFNAVPSEYVDFDFYNDKKSIQIDLKGGGVIEDPVADINDLEVLAQNCTSVLLTWSDVTGEEGYRVRRKESSAGSYSILEDLPAGAESYTDQTVAEGVDYTYMVRPMKSGNAVAVSNTPSIEIPACEPDVLEPEISFQGIEVGQVLSGEKVIKTFAFDPNYGNDHGDGVERIAYQIFDAKDLSSQLDIFFMYEAPFYWNLNTENYANGDYQIRAGVKSLDGENKWTVLNIKISNVITGIAGKSSENNFKAFPNPTQGNLNLTHSVSWKLFNLTGKLIMDGKSDKVDMTELTKGMYFLEAEGVRLKVLKK